MADCVLPDSPVLSTVDLKKRKGQQKPPHPSCIGLLLLSPPALSPAHPSTESSLGPSIVQLVEREGGGRGREEGVFCATIHMQEVWPQPQYQMHFPCLSVFLALYSSFCPFLLDCTPSDLLQLSALPTGQGDRMDCLASGYRRSQSLRRRVSSGR